MKIFSRRTTLQLAAAFSASLSCGLAARAADDKERPSAGKRAVIVYFSMPETNKADGMTPDEGNSTHIVDGRVYGNVEWLAEIIRRETGADVIRLQPEVAYPTAHKILVPQADEEKKQNVRPALSEATKRALEKLPGYDTVFLGRPIWWYTYPMILLSFLENYSLAGKNVIPFVAHDGSGFADTLERLAELQPKAKILPGYSVSRTRMQSAEKDVAAWLKSLNLKY